MHRKLFYRKLLISNLIFYLAIIYFIFILIESSFLIKQSLNKENINKEAFLINVIFIITGFDLTIKLLFYQIKIINIYPYLRFNIPRRKLADFLIIMNHLNIKNWFCFLLLIPFIIIISNNLKLIDLVITITTLFTIYIFNNYLSMIVSLIRLNYHFIILIPIIFFFLFILIWNKLQLDIVNILIEVKHTIKVLFVLIPIFLSRLSHLFLREKLITLLYVLN